MKRAVIILVVSVVLFTSCTDAFKASISSYGDKHRVTMYNGGVKVREWISTGKVESMSDSDGWQFMDAETRKLVRVGGDVIIEVIE